MQLLTKSEVQQRKGADRKLEIDEGLKVARRVDGLRKAFSEEEQRLAEFRKSAVAAAMEEVQKYTDLRDTTRKEAEEAEERLRIARIPLDEEWKEVAEAERAVVVRTEAITEHEAALDALEERLAQQAKEIDLEERRIVDLRVRADEALIEAHHELTNAKSIRTQADKDASRQEVALRERETNVQAREAAASNREASNDARAKTLDARERYLNDEERRIQDREKLLLRNIKRYATN